MPRAAKVLLPVVLLIPPTLFAQQSPAAHVESIEILSDTHGTNLSPYLRNLARLLDTPADLAASPASAMIRVTIAPDGTISAMHLDASTHSTAFDRAAWGAITRNSTLPAPPTGPLELRIHFNATVATVPNP